MLPLTVPGTRDSLGAVAKFVLAAAAEAGLDKKASYRLRLALDELATNVVAYGYEQGQREGELYVSALIDAEGLSIVLEDTGPEYDPTKAAKPLSLELPPEERQIGGLGIFLTLRSVDHFAYERAGDRNRNTITMKRPQAPSG